MYEYPLGKHKIKLVGKSAGCVSAPEVELGCQLRILQSACVYQEAASQLNANLSAVADASYDGMGSEK